MSYEQVLKLPLRTFWSLNKQLDRLRSEEDQRSLRLMVAVESGDGVERLSRTLQAEINAPIRFETVFDEAKFELFKQKFSKPKDNIKVEE